jgi:hypothetical protein
MAGPRSQVGTLREKPLHAALKRWCARPGDRFEVAVDGFVVDVVRDDLLIEVQTRGFSSMKRKLTTLLTAGYRIRIVHPISLDTTIIKVDDAGQVLGRRRSPRHGHPTDLFSELVSFPSLIEHPGLEIELVMVRDEELRTHDPSKAWRRRGWVIDERRLIEVVDSMLIGGIEDLCDLLPTSLPPTFTTADLAAALGRPRRIAQQMAYCLRDAGGIRQVGKRGNAMEYERRWTQ